ncbi:hypothetical protein ACOZZ1_001520 [Vibrio fluvialis]|uniref:hypothetical protein n=1 Tax=Vibrio fluvialis TaxID=676 RepID=UPI00096BCA17|nr:hypothetical protein [Vibrio fluvialis]ELI5734470.1 hypothetical protein [Vibrio fluvialis]
MKQMWVLVGLSALLSGCGGEDIDNAIVDSFGKNFETQAEKEEYAQYVADSTAAIVNAVLDAKATSACDSGECSLNGYSYTVGSRDYTLQTSSKVTLTQSGNTLVVTAKQTNPDQQIFLKDVNSGTSRIAVNLLDGTYSLQIVGSSAPYQVYLHALFTDSQETYGEMGTTFKVHSDSKFQYAGAILTGGSATTTYKQSNTYQWTLDTAGDVALK